MDQSDIGAQVRASTQVAQQTAAQPEGCKVCKRPGLPILPLRYAVVPKGKRKGAGPELHTTLGSGVKDVKLPGDTHEYALRALREGYVYVLLDKKIWQGYEVTAQGHLRQFDPFNSPKAPPEPLVKRCHDEGHDIPGSFLNVDPNQYKTAWIAFSQDPWTATVLNEYKSGKRPSERFTKIDIKKLLEKPDTVQHAFEIDSALNRLSKGVEEFAKDAKDFGSIHGFCQRHERAGHYREFVKRQQITHPKDKVAALVLMDPAGIVQELNAARLIMVEKRQTYVSHPYNVRRLMVSNSILGLKKIIEEPARLASMSESGSTDDEDNLPVLESSVNTGGDSPAEQAEQDAKATWAKMQKFYSEPQRDLFARKYEKELKNFQAWINLYGKDYAAWAERQDWIKLFHDYDNNDVKSSLSLTCMAAPCLSGGPTDQATHALWKAWLNAKPDDTRSPVYSALFGGQIDLLKYLTPEGGKLNKTDKLYDTIKGLAESKQYEKHIKEPLLEGVSHIQLAMAGALSALGDQIEKPAEAIAVRAQQATLLLYRKIEVTILRISMTVGEYHTLLSDAVFSKIGKPFAHLAKQGQRQVKSLALAGVLRIDNPKVRDTVIEVTIWSMERAEVILKELKALSSTTKVNARKAAQSIKLHALNLSGEAAKTLAQLEQLAQRGAPLAKLAKQMAAKTVRIAGSADILLGAGAIGLQAWSFRDSMKDVADKLGAQKNEALLGLGSAGVGFVGATTQVIGHAIKLGVAQTSTWQAVGLRFVKTGGIIAAVASAVDGVQAFLAAYRTGSKGDDDAARLYKWSGVFFVGGAIAGGIAAYAGAATLLGPLGIALALIAIGVLLSWAALNAEDTPVQIWLDRCAFGVGKRKEGKWTDAEAADEMSELNALMLGLKVELAWEDNWGFDGFTTRITLPGFSGDNSAYEYTISAKGKGGAWTPVVTERYGMTATAYDSWSVPNATHRFNIDKPTFKKQDGGLVVQHNFRLDDKLFSEAKVAVRYFQEKSDPQAEARVTLEQVD